MLADRDKFKGQKNNVIEAANFNEYRTAPAIGTVREVSRKPVVDETMIIAFTDGSILIPEYHYRETGIGFRNLRISPGTRLQVSYHYRVYPAIGNESFRDGSSRYSTVSGTSSLSGGTSSGSSVGFATQVKMGG